MAKEILMPKLGLTMKTGTVIRWLKSVGDPVTEHEPLIEIETEKLSHQIEAPAGGVLIKKLAKTGEKYPVACVLGYIGAEGEEVDTPEEPVPQETVLPDHGGRIFISPVAKKLAAALNIDYRQIHGTGPNGRIVKADIESFASNQIIGSSDGSTYILLADDLASAIIPYTGMRRAIGENMLKSWSAAPMVTHHVTADVTELAELREKLNQSVDKSEKVSVNDLILKLAAVALSKMPIINSTLTDEGIVMHGRVHLGMATAIPGGLVVPVIHSADRKSLLQISREARDFAERARDGRLGYDETTGGTFTVTNLGSYGSVDLFTPIINPPQAAILGVGRIVDAVMPIGGEIRIRKTMGLSFTYDHRIIDGATAAEFMAAFLKLLENPARSILL